jgi:hypothetical protein
MCPIGTEPVLLRTRTSPDGGPTGLPYPIPDPLAHLLPFEAPQNLIRPLHLFACARTDARSLPGLPTPETASDPLLPVRSGSLRDLPDDQLGAVG